jgi:putative transposase
LSRAEAAGSFGVMPRTARASVGGYCYHVLNRGNARGQVFHADADYRAFLQTVADTRAFVPMRVLAYCLMPNHFHLVLWPHADGDLSRFLHRLSTAHVRRYHCRYRGTGHVWQGRFKAFPIQEDEHLLIVLRYVERNPVRAGLVAWAEDWFWSSAAAEAVVRVDAGPVARLAEWLDWVNRPNTEAEAERLRECTARGRPFGSDGWAAATAVRLGLGASLRPRGRPPRSTADGPTLF